MTPAAAILAPAARLYRGAMTRPERWATWTPRAGDILVCTPPKCGTTWTQTILAMLVHGGTDLPAALPVLSPWVDADLGVPAEDVQKALAAQTGRRVVKTHTPADGFPIWQGVTVIAVYRHPLDVFFSLRNHMANRVHPAEDTPLARPLTEAFEAYIHDPSDGTDIDRDNLTNLTTHYRQTVLSGRLPDIKVFHYADMLRDGRRTVQALARAAGIDATPHVIDQVAEATAFQAMKARAFDYVPVAGTGFWKSDADFFDSAGARKWQSQLSEAQLAQFDTRLAALIPQPGARAWLTDGAGTAAPDGS
ncbi:MAG: sulfotransferase domain-containing protein [Candidatus Saccharibacteria bacterium]|nr:sulfotransferase domain-containing protein [Pseudorhodobacter sp.]